MQELAQIRHEIEQLDAQIIDKLAQREKLSRRVGQLKVQLDKEVVDLAREKQLMDYYRTLCAKHQLNNDFIQQLFALIITYSRSLQH